MGPIQFNRDADELERLSKISSLEESWRTARVIKGTDHTCVVKRLRDLGLVNVVKRKKVTSNGFLQLFDRWLQRRQSLALLTSTRLCNKGQWPQQENIFHCGSNAALEYALQMSWNLSLLGNFQILAR